MIVQVIKIGRSQHNDIIVNNTYTSGSHCEIVLYDNGVFELSDFSCNGTYVNGYLVSNTKCILRNNDVIHVSGVQVNWQPYFNQAVYNNKPSNSSYQPEEQDDYNDDYDYDEYSSYDSQHRDHVYRSEHVYINANVNKRGDDFSKKFFENMGDKMGDSIGSTLGCIVSAFIIFAVIALIIAIIA